MIVLNGEPIYNLHDAVQYIERIVSPMLAEFMTEEMNGIMFEYGQLELELGEEKRCGELRNEEWWRICSDARDDLQEALSKKRLDRKDISQVWENLNNVL